MSSEKPIPVQRLKPLNMSAFSKKIDSVRDVRNQKATKLTKISSDLYLTIPKSEKKFNLNNPKNIDAKEKLLDGAAIPETYKAGVDKHDMNNYGDPIDVIQFISNNPLFRTYIINNFNITRKDFEVYFLTQDEFNTLITKNEYLENALVNYLKTKKYNVVPLYTKYIKNPTSMKELRSIRKAAEAEYLKNNHNEDEYDDEDDDEYAEYLDEDSKPVKKSFAAKTLNYDREDYNSQGKLTPGRTIILWLCVFIVFLILNVSMVPFENYGTRLLSIATEFLILYMTYKGVRWALMANQTLTQ